MKKLILLFLLFIPLSVYANDTDITKNVNITISNTNLNGFIFDDNYKTFIDIAMDDSIIINSNTPIDSLYIIYKEKAEKGIIDYNNKRKTIGENNFIHEYIKLDENTSSLNIKYLNNTSISEIYVLKEGVLPSYIQNWHQPNKKIDLMLFSTHADDEQLFFSGLIPTYINEGKNIEVVYLTHHLDKYERIHEQLNGLWELGIKNYPILGIIPDEYSDSLINATKNLEKENILVEDIIKFQVTQIRKYKPSVVVGHDEFGEYGHGQHILNTACLKEAIERSNDTTYYKDISYKNWDVLKVYLHLYEDNKIILDYDIPLPYYQNQTAYQVGKKGYLMHKSQQYTWYTKWLNGVNFEYTEAKQITKYSPCEYGLYKTNVGEDYLKNNMFENIKLENQTKNNENPIEKSHQKKNNNLFLIFECVLLIFFSIYVIKKRKQLG